MNVQSFIGGSQRLGLWWLFAIVITLLSGCTAVGPEYARPDLQVLEQWMQADGSRVRALKADGPEWWAAFQDPVLDNLVQTAYAQNIPLRVAGARVFEARARLGIAIGEQYPQVQQAVGAASYNRESERGPSAPQQSGGVGFRLPAGPGGSHRQLGNRFLGQVPARG